MEHYLLPVIDPVRPTREIQVVLALVFVGVNAPPYGLVGWARSRRAAESV